jgi:RNA polymerase sigma factor (sigma-70 family)
MQAEEFFATEWPDVARSLRWMLARAGAPERDQDDLVQETALRLLRIWASVDPHRPVEALARRIATNAWRDQWRRRGCRELLGGIPDNEGVADTERAALARVEVQEVARALRTLRPRTAETLRAAAYEVEGATECIGPASAALRMARSRARRQLTACVGRAAVSAA